MDRELLEAFAQLARAQANSAPQRGDFAGPSWLRLATLCEARLARPAAKEKPEK
jgi:hypothetical protein